MKRKLSRRPCPMSCWAARKWNEPLSLCLYAKDECVIARSVLSTFCYHPIKRIVSCCEQAVFE
jgi:hypothetical protein